MLHLLEIPIDQPLLIRGRDRLLDALGRELHREVGGVLDELTLGESHLQLDLAAGLLEQPVALRGGRCGNALLFGGDLFRAAPLQRFDFAGQRLQLAVDLARAARSPRS